jgi:reverse transcriptase-like protein
VAIQPAIAGLTRDQLLSALNRVEHANDMLPPREDDKVAGRIGPSFVEGVLARIASGDYRCAGAAFVPVPKRALTTRPAAVSTLRDRVVLEALVDLARPNITRHLVSAEVLLWPRADETLPVWNEFERVPLGKGGGYVVSADVAGFYESIHHDRLKVSLADAGVDSDLRSAITAVLHDLMADDRGLPQGVQASDPLATLYLTQVDSELQRSGITFWRHGDDFRLWGATYPDALAAIFELEQALRRRGLLLSAGKLNVDRLSKYSLALSDVDLASERFRGTMKEAREQALLKATPEELIKAAEDAGIDEDMQWRFFYHQTMGMPEMLEMLAPSLTPGPVEIVVEMFKEVVSKTKSDLPGHIAHARLTFCLRRLARAKAPDALPWVGDLLVRRPDEAQELANYMLALISVDPQTIVAACQYALTNTGHLLDWERAWIYRVLSRAANLVAVPILGKARQIAESDSFNWLARVEATRLLARSGLLTQGTALNIARTAPECFQGDLAGIIAMVEKPNNWAAKYLDGARQDALQATVIDGVREKIGGQQGR